MNLVDSSKELLGYQRRMRQPIVKNDENDKIIA
jgi:hypothetical protein